MNTPLFKVGERVGLVSRNLPQFNGEYIVHDIFEEGDNLTCRITGMQVSVKGSGFGYRFTKVIRVPSEKYESSFDESALRKLHKPSQFSFDELMQELKVVKHDNIPV